MKNKIMKCIIFNLVVVTMLVPVWAMAATFPIPTKMNDLIGHTQDARIGLHDNNFHALGREFDIGFDQMREANPKMDPKSPGLWRDALIPSEYILPPGPHKGIVINLPEMRLYYYPVYSHEVVTFPVGIGIAGWETPLGNTKIISKRTNPSWYVPKSVAKYLAEKGVHLPKVVPPGPENPLGNYAIRLAIPGYLLHGTNMPTSIGTRASSGCIRLYPEDIKSLYSMIPINTPVKIIYQPYKVGWYHGKLYLEAHAPIADEGEAKTKKDSAASEDLTSLTNEIVAALKQRQVDVDWKKAVHVALQHNGIPQVISIAKDVVVKKVKKHLPVPSIFFDSV